MNNTSDQQTNGSVVNRRWFLRTGLLAGAAIVTESFANSPLGALPNAFAQGGDDPEGFILPGDFQTLPLNDAGQYIITDPDSTQEILLNKVDGFTPDGNLKMSDLQEIPLDMSEAALYADFESSLNNPQMPLAGFHYGTNDYNQYYARLSGPQLPMLSWEVFTGIEMFLPNIGHMKAGGDRAVCLVILNRAESVHQWEDSTVYVNAGYMGTGRLWDASDPNKLAVAEQGLQHHHLNRLALGVEATGFVGQCDLVDNCNEALVVSVERLQWGVWEGSNDPRYIWRLIRAEVQNLAAIKTEG